MDPALALAPSSRRRVTAVLACAEADAANLVGVVRALVSDGVRVEIVCIDRDVRPLELALDERRGPTLWVLCPGVPFDPRHRQLLDLTIAAHEIASVDLVATRFDADDPMRLVRMLRPRLRQMADETSTPGVATPPLPAVVPTLDPVAASTSAALRRHASPGARRWRTTGVAALALAITTAAAWVALRGTAPLPVPQVEPATLGPAPVATTPPPVSPPPTTEPAVPSVDEALHDRRLRALDALLVTTEGPSTPSSAARARCAAVAYTGAPTWRLPNPKELVALGRAGFLDVEQRYWVRAGARLKSRRWTERGLERRGRGDVVALCVADSPPP